MNIILKSAHIENFKGIKCKDITFTKNQKIKGRNGSGKTTIVDAILWLLFNKNSEYSTDFGVRPLDSDGKTIHFVDIVVKAVVEIDGVEHELSKTQKENWVKPRGAEESVFKGNVNTFEIDGYPRSEKEYKEFVGGLIDEEMFKILTSATYFNSLPWKKQRETLMLFANDEKDIDLAKRIGGFDDLMDELSKAPSTADILNKYKKAKKELETKLVELPVRIDEVSRSKVDYDVAELEIQKKVLEEKIAQAESKVDVDALRKRKMEIDFEMSRISNEENNKVSTLRRETQTSIAILERKIADNDNRVERNKKDIAFIVSGIESKKKDFEALKKQFEEIKESVFPSDDWVFDENSTICKACGQKLPADRIFEIKADFEKRKAQAESDFEINKKQTLDNLNQRGAMINNDIKTIGARKDDLVNEVEEITKETLNAKIELEGLTNDLRNMTSFADLNSNEDYKALAKESEEIVNQISELEKAELETNLAIMTAKSELAIVEGKLRESENNDKIDERIESLKAEQKETSQKVATCEKFIYLTEQFIRAKLDAITSSVNSKFEGITFKLFDEQINGGMAECCECCVGGVPYSDLNNGHKIVAGLSIIKTLSDFYGKKPFVFVDNAESVNNDNLIDIGSQLIALYVTDDKELVVEGGE